MEDPIPIVHICPNCSAVFVLTEYIPDSASIYKRCLVCRRKLKITPDRVEIIMTLVQIISGGQTGVDRAGLDAAIEIGLLIGGYVPKGRLAEDGQVPDKYPMTETGSKNYKDRTKRNVLESDGTLIINIGPMVSGTALTAIIALEHNKPLMIVQLDQAYQTSVVIDWLDENRIQILNIAGPRESKRPGIYEQTKMFLLREIFIR